MVKEVVVIIVAMIVATAVAVALDQLRQSLTSLRTYQDMEMTLSPSQRMPLHNTQSSGQISIIRRNQDMVR